MKQASPELLEAMRRDDAEKVRQHPDLYVLLNGFAYPRQSLLHNKSLQAAYKREYGKDFDPERRTGEK